MKTGKSSISKMPPFTLYLTSVCEIVLFLLSIQNKYIHTYQTNEGTNCKHKQAKAARNMSNEKTNRRKKKSEKKREKARCHCQQPPTTKSP